MKNSEGLTHKQFLFCEELLKNGFCVYKAYKAAYPNDSSERNGPRMLKRKEVIEYLNKRQQEKQATMDKLLDAAHKRLMRIIEEGNDKDAAKAIEILENTATRAKELQAAIQKPEDAKQITINIQPVTKQ